MVYQDYDPDVYPDEIRYFEQLPKESYDEAWLRIREMVENLGMDGLTISELVSLYWRGLKSETREILGDEFLSMNTDEVFDFLEKYSQPEEWVSLPRRKHIRREEYQDYDSEEEYSYELQYFEQFPEETWEDAWRRMKELFEACHRRGKHILDCMQWYYEGLNESTIKELNIACGRAFGLNTPREGYAFLQGKSQTQFVEVNSQSEEEPQEVQEFNPSCALPDDTQLDVIPTPSSSEPYELFPISNEHENFVDVEIIASTSLQVFSFPSFVPSTTNSLLQDKEDTKLSHSQSDLADMTMEEFLNEFMEPGDILSKIIAQEVESLPSPLIEVDLKQDYPVDFHQDVHPANHNGAPFHLWLGNLSPEGTYHYFHPHLNLSVGEDNLVSSK